MRRIECSADSRLQRPLRNSAIQELRHTRACHGYLAVTCTVVAMTPTSRTAQSLSPCSAGQLAPAQAGDVTK